MSNAKEFSARQLKWEKGVAEAKSLITQSKQKYYIRIAQLAISCCEITRGGAVKKGENPYTLRRFAKEIGINSQTLSNYVALYRAVFSKLPDGYQEKLSLSEAAHIKQIKRESTPEQVKKIVDKHLSTDSEAKKYNRYMRHIRTLSNAVVWRGALFVMEDRTISELGFFCDQILKEIKKTKPKLLLKESGVARENHNRSLSAAHMELGQKR